MQLNMSLSPGQPGNWYNKEYAQTQKILFDKNQYKHYLRFSWISEK